MPTRLWLVVCLTTLLVTPSVSAQEHPGATPYNQVCQFCHGAEGRGDMAPGLVPLGYDPDYVLAIVRKGYGQMPPISTRELNDNEIRQVVSYLESLSQPVAPTTSYEGPRTADGHPDLNGIWQVLSTAAWNIQAHNAQSDVPAGLSVVEGNEIPYQSWAASQQRENYANRATEDPVGKCYLPGVPRVTYMPFPFQILQTPDHVVMTYEFAHAVRIIYTDGSPHPLPNDFWMGDSRGRWDGDTLVVDTTHFNDRTWFDAAGNFHSDALHVVERYTPTSLYHIDYEVTIEDPNVFTRSWTMRMPLYRRVEEGLQLLDYDCVDFTLQALTASEGGPR